MKIDDRGNSLTGRRDGIPVFTISYCSSPTPGIPIVNDGWRLYEIRWHKTRFGKPVKNKNPREALVGTFQSKARALEEARTRYGE